MRKKARIWAVVLWAVFWGVVSVGCAGGELLEEIPRDFALLKPQSGDAGGRAAEDSPAAQGSASADSPAAQGSASADSPAIQGSLPEAAAGSLGRIPKTLAGNAGEAEPSVSFLMDEAFHFARDSLGEAEQGWYDDMERILGSFGEGGKLGGEGLKAGLDESCIDRIFQCVLCDHPELFYVEGYSYTKFLRGEQLFSIEFSGAYSMDVQTALARRGEILEAADAILAGAGEDADDYEKVKYVYDTLILDTDYDLTASDSQNIYSVFVRHLSVCQGYAKATQYLLNRLGIECVLVLGTVETGEGHAWNLVKVDGHHYYVDTTWGDVSYRIDESLPWDGEMPEINYDFLNVTTEELLRTHTIGGAVPMPLCTASEANYYVREGALFTGYDREQMRALFGRAAEKGRRDVTVKCSDGACYEEIWRALIEEQEIFGYLPDAKGGIAYARNEKQFSLTFWVTNE